MPWSWECTRITRKTSTWHKSYTTFLKHFMSCVWNFILNRSFSQSLQKNAHYRVMKMLKKLFHFQRRIHFLWFDCFAVFTEFLISDICIHNPLCSQTVKESHWPKELSWRKYRIGINWEPIRTIPIHSDICIRANANHSEPIRKTFCISFDEKSDLIRGSNPNESDSIRARIENLVSDSFG